MAALLPSVTGDEGTGTLNGLVASNGRPDVAEKVAGTGLVVVVVVGVGLVVVGVGLGVLVDFSSITVGVSVVLVVAGVLPVVTSDVALVVVVVSTGLVAVLSPVGLGVGRDVAAAVGTRVTSTAPSMVLPWRLANVRSSRESLTVARNVTLYARFLPTAR
jgi:hypothetical protein